MREKVFNFFKSGLKF